MKSNSINEYCARECILCYNPNSSCQIYKLGFNLSTECFSGDFSTRETVEYLEKRCLKFLSI